MIASFFQTLDEYRVEYLLISGQAAVLYGAATFSEDIDLWIDPTAVNCERLRHALRACGARYYKLTPPLTADNLGRGHGFHFVLSAPGTDEVFLDLMGLPPRGGSFAAARAASRRWSTDWGRLPVVGIKELIEIKKTQRLEDYPVISRLALAWFDHHAGTITPGDFAWAAENIFALETLRLLYASQPRAKEVLPNQAPRELAEFARQAAADKETSAALEQKVVAWMQQRMAALQQADRQYWRNIIAELKQWRAQGVLMPEGALV